jgi:hypothetical protein
MGCDFSQFAFSSAGHFGDSFPQAELLEYEPGMKKGQ